MRIIGYYSILVIEYSEIAVLQESVESNIWCVGERLRRGDKNEKIDNDNIRQDRFGS